MLLFGAYNFFVKKLQIHTGWSWPKGDNLQLARSPHQCKWCSFLQDTLLHQNIIYLFYIFLNWGHFRPPSLYFRLFWIAIDRYTFKIIHCQCLDSNRGSLVSEATTLPTAPQPWPYIGIILCWLTVLRY